MTGVTSLPGALRGHARGLYCLHAAVELLIGHAAWLQHEDFLRDFVHTVPRPAGSSPIAVIDWPRAITSLAQDRLPSSGSERRILRIAASLADGIPVDLHDALTGLDSHNTELVSKAVMHASGHR